MAARHAAVCSGAGAAQLDALADQLDARLDFYIGTAVTEIATLRAQLYGANQG